MRGITFFALGPGPGPGPDVVNLDLTSKFEFAG